MAYASPYIESVIFIGWKSLPLCPAREYYEGGVEWSGAQNIDL